MGREGRRYLGGLGRSATVPGVNTRGEGRRGAVLMLLPLAPAQRLTGLETHTDPRPESRVPESRDPHPRPRPESPAPSRAPVPSPRQAAADRAAVSPPVVVLYLDPSRFAAETAARSYPVSGKCAGPSVGLPPARCTQPLPSSGGTAGKSGLRQPNPRVPFFFFPSNGIILKLPLMTKYDRVKRLN